MSKPDKAKKTKPAAKVAERGSSRFSKPAVKAKETGSSRFSKPAVKAKETGSSRFSKPAAKAKPAPAAAKAKPTATTDKAKAKAITDRIAKPATDRLVKTATVDKAAKPTAEKPAKSAKASERADKPDESEKPGKGAKGRETKERLRSAEVITYKCPFGSSELSEWRSVLLQRRAEITNDIQGLYKDAIEAEDGHTTPNHIAERGSDADLQDMSLGMAGEEENILWQIDRALHKIETGTPLPFGVCEFNKQTIPRTRLQLIPWTPLSFEGAQHLEDSRLALEDLLVDG